MSCVSERASLHVRLLSPCIVLPRFPPSALSSTPTPLSPSLSIISSHRVRTPMVAAIHSLSYSLFEHPSIVKFRWNHNHSWESTWFFLFSSIAAYIAFSQFLRITLSLFRRNRPVPLGLVPAIHSLAMALVSMVIFAGILVSSAAEIRDTRWFWRRSKTAFQWFLCFPLGTRLSGRVFFWSYVFYLSRFLQLFRTIFSILLRRRRLTFSHLLHHSIVIFMSFLWLEFSQSFQVVAILSTTLVYAVVYGYHFWVAVGLPTVCFPIVLNCQIVLLACNLVSHLGVLLLHFMKGGCNGIGAKEAVFRRRGERRRGCFSPVRGEETVLRGREREGGRIQWEGRRR